ncbi:MAG: hypothetical protein HY460_00270, partial [Parcubacteria group bacterium]|nr:hypothetical protein [Parcubacteria group bacterium]
YRQQRRWGWGVENIPYFLFGFLKNKRIPFRKKLYFRFVIIESFHSWATNAIMIFLLGWLPLVLGSDAFRVTEFAYHLPQVTRWLMTAAMLGVVTSAFLSMTLLPPRPPEYGRYRTVMMAIQWIFLPFTIIVFGAVPGLEAQTRLMFGSYLGFWVTEKAYTP